MEPTKETVQETLNAAEVSKEELVDGRTNLGKLQAKVKELEDNQKKIQEILVEHKKKIDECSVRR